MMGTKLLLVVVERTILIDYSEKNYVVNCLIKQLF